MISRVMTEQPTRVRGMPLCLRVVRGAAHWTPTGGVSALVIQLDISITTEARLTGIGKSWGISGYLLQ